MASLAVVCVPAMGPAMAAALRVSPTLVGAYVALLFSGATLASLLAGPLVTRYGAMRMSQWGLLFGAAGLVLLAVTPWAWLAAPAALLIGLGYGPITPASSHLLAKTTPAHRLALVFSIKQTGVPLGGVVAGLAVPALLLAGGTPAALLSIAAASAACALLSQPLRAVLDEDRQPAQPLGFASLAGPMRLVLGHPGLARLTMFTLVFAAVQMSLTSYLVTYLHSALGYSLVTAGLVLSVAQAGGVAGRIVWGYASDRWVEARRMLALLAGMMALCAVAAAALQPSAPLALVLLVMAAFGASSSGWNGVYLAEVARLAPPGMASAATGGSLGMGFFGVVAGPALFGAAASFFESYRIAFLLLALPTALCAWGLWASGRGR